MPIQTLLCPECTNSQTVDIPAGTRAVLDHRASGDVVRVTPRVMPIRRPSDPEFDMLSPFTPFPFGTESSE